MTNSDDAETAHLLDLARASTAAPRVRRKRSPQTVPSSVQRVIDAITTAPAWVRNDRGDVLASNKLGRALYLEMTADGGTPPNSARFTFLSPKAREFPGLRINIYTAEPGTPSEDALKVLASWAATQRSMTEAAAHQTR